MRGTGSMKPFEIFDAENKNYIGHLLYFEKEKSIIIELSEKLDEWTAPLLFSGFIKRGIFTIPRSASRLWVRERVIPSGRQNISTILANHKLKEYDEMKMLMISRGRCSQDSLQIRESEILPDYILERMKHNLTGLFTSEEHVCICFFADESVKKVDLKKLREAEGVDKIISNEKLFESACMGAGGYYATFNDSIDLPSSLLYNGGTLIPIRKNDFVRFVQKNVLDTAETETLLGCSRQNIAYMVKRNHITPMKEDVMGNLYLKDDVLRSRW